MTASKRPAAGLLHRELGGLWSIVMLLRGRKDVPAGATVIRYGSSQKAFVVVMMILAPIEIALVELLVPWLWLRAVLLLLGGSGLLWLFGFYAALRTRPHYVDRERLVLRTGHLAAVSLDVGSIRGVRHAAHQNHKGFVDVTDGVVAVPGTGGTALTVTLLPESSVHVQGRGRTPAREVRFDADDPTAAVRAINDHIGPADR